MTNNKHLDGVLTELDLISAWRHMLRETKATHVEVDLDELDFGLIDETRNHYGRVDVSRPQLQALEDFNHDRWWWDRLKKRIERKRNQ